MKKTFWVLSFTVLSILFVGVSQSYARGDHDKDKYKDKDKDKGSDKHAPLDGGLTILLAAGVGLGAKKIMDRSKKSKGAADLA